MFQYVPICSNHDQAAPELRPASRQRMVACHVAWSIKWHQLQRHQPLGSLKPVGTLKSNGNHHDPPWYYHPFSRWKQPHVTIGKPNSGPWYPPFWDRPKLQLIVAIVVSTANRPINLDIKNINPTRHMDRENDLNIFRIIQNYSNLDQICRVIFFCAHGSHLSKRLFRCKACA